MALNTAALQIGASAMATALAYASIHSGNPGATGANESTAARQATGMTASGGNMALSGAKNFTGGAANGPALFVGFWSAATGGTFYGSQQLTGDQAFNSAGQYTLNSLTETGSAS
jgi:hypothetical protein